MYSANTNEPLMVDFSDWGVYILESHHSGDFYMPPSRHDYFKFVYVLEGEGSVRFEDSELELGPEDLVIIPQGKEHQLADRSKNPLALIVLCLQEKVLASLGETPELFKRVSIQKPVGDEIRKLLRQLFFEQSLQKPHCGPMMMGLALQFTALLSRFQGEVEQTGEIYDAKTLASVRVKSYINHLQTRFYVDETLGDVANRLGVSRRYFSLLFKEHVGESWLTHIRSLRVEYAKKLLLSSDRSVTTITFECGFNDLSNFYRCFKKLEGTSPEKWRQAQRLCRMA